MNNTAALQEHDEGNVLKFAIQTKIEDDNRQKLMAHMCLEECRQIEYICQKIPHQEVEDLLLEFERKEQEEAQSNNGAALISEDAD